jgi:hypothetical protein
MASWVSPQMWGAEKSNPREHSWAAAQEREHTVSMVAGVRGDFLASLIVDLVGRTQRARRL